MKIAVSAEGAGLEARTSTIFGRCPYMVFVDTDTWACESLPNAAQGASGGAGVQAAQGVVERGAQAVITGNVGPNAFEVLRAAGVRVYPFDGGTVRDAVEAFRGGSLRDAPEGTVADHSGVRTLAPVASAQTEREAEIQSLRAEAREVRKQLADIMDRIDRLTQGG